ncbi:MAG: tyrosine-type recombinase/integrase [Streptosporangiaceae bacterium]
MTGGLQVADAQAVLAEHLRWLRMLGRSDTTIDGRRYALARLAAALPCPLLAAGEAELLDWRAGLTVSNGAVRSYVSHARQFYGWAARAGVIGADPAGDLPVPPRARRLPRPIGTGDLFSALSAAPPRIRLWLVLAAWCGLRCKEITLLRRECILLAAPQPVLLIAGDATKGTSERTVPLSRFVVAEITTAGLPLSGWCFLRADGRPGPNRPARVSGLASEFLRGSGIPATLHQLRHWFGTGAYAAEKDLRAVQELMGHRSVEATQGYADWDRSAAAATVEALPVPPRLRVVGDAGHAVQ